MQGSPIAVIRSFIRRYTLEVMNAVFDHDWLLRLIGLVGKKFGVIESVFLVYPASEEYALSYVFSYRLPKVKWDPWLCGALLQNCKLSLMFCISASNSEYAEPANIDKLRKVTERMEKLRILLGANRKTFAGIIPGVLHTRRIIRDVPEADLTASAVAQAIDLIKVKESLSPETPIIVLGGKGFIGRRLVKLLNKATTFSIDLADGQGKKDWPNQLSGQRIIVVNITLNRAIEDYIDQMWPGTVVINEVYPEPDAIILQKLAEKKCQCYHVVGVKAAAFPQFPLAYRGAIPCCAAWPAKKMKAVVKKL